MRLFKRIRPRDINLEAAVYSTRQQLTYHAFNEPALNTFDKALAKERARGTYRIVEEIKIETLPLSEILERHVPTGTKIDFLNVDVEGLDLEVLRSNDWNRYSPEFIFVECFESSTWEQVASDPLAQFLMKRRYSIVGKTMHTVLFRFMAPEQDRNSI
jgi:FkbM family methyltransferase